MERNLLKYVWMHSRKEQLWMLVVILASMPTYFLSLELPKRIVNSPIQGVGFENPGDTAKFLETGLPFGETIFGVPVNIFNGFEMERVSYLWALSVSFLALVVANGLFKLYINTYKGRMGERILRRLRYELFDRVLRYPLSRFRRTKASEIASMIKDEVEPMGEFIGDAFTQPLFLGGQAAVALLFIMLQNFWLGVVTLVVVLFQAWLIPILRRRLIELNKQRQISARRFAGRIGEVVEGIQDAHTNDTTNYHRSEITSILGRLFFIRFELFQRKFSVKFLNNLLIQFLAFFFYAVGGYLAIRGTLDIGQLIGVIVAYKDLPAPVRGLIDYDQKRQMVEVRYSQVVEQFIVDQLQESKLQEIPEGEVPHIKTGFDVTRLGVVDDTGSTLLETATTKISAQENIAVVGNFSSGASTFAAVLAGVVKPTSGSVELDEVQIEEQPEYFLGRRIGYIDGSTYFPQGTIYENLTLVLKNQPVGNDNDRTRDDLAIAEVKRTDNFPHDFEADWLDINRTGAEDSTQLVGKIGEILKAVELEGDIRALGLRGTLNPDEHPELTEAILKARQVFRERLNDLGFTEIVEPFDPSKYNNQSSIGENLLFGTAVDPAFEADNLASNPLIREALAAQELELPLYDMGKEVTRTTLELFGDLDPENPFFDQLTYMDADELPEYRALLTRIGNDPPSEVPEEDRVMIMKLALSYTEDLNRLGLLDEDLKLKLLEARSELRSHLESLPELPVSFYETDLYNPAASLLDNVLLGRVSQTVAEGQERVTTAIRDLLDELELTDDIFNIGLGFNVGSGGKRLSEAQRQKLHLARVLLKRPDVLIVNLGLNSLGHREQERAIQTVLAASKGDSAFGVIWVPVNAGFAEMFDRVLLFDSGELVADSTATELSNSNELYKELLS